MSYSKLHTTKRDSELKTDRGPDTKRQRGDRVKTEKKDGGETIGDPFTIITLPYLPILSISLSIIRNVSFFRPPRSYCTVVAKHSKIEKEIDSNDRFEFESVGGSTLPVSAANLYIENIQ
jgi:hypothetical protein